MDKNIIVNKINKILVEDIKQVDEFELTVDKHLVYDFHLDSLNILEIFLDIMSEFNIELDREEISGLMKLENLYDYVYNTIDNLET